MASLAAAYRISATLARRSLVHDGVVRGFTSSARSLAAQNFTMPALSPTMTEGNIASWRVKEGDKFAAGDVLLEIETDKATMDVEAQDDGILMKIMQGDGAKSVQVGRRIAVLADADDDVAALEIPPDESPDKAAAESDDAAKDGGASSRPDKPDERSPPGPSSTKQAPKRSGADAPKRSYPLYPSVARLMRENGLDESAAADMTPTGPNGRLLKGDVLAYLGTINADTPSRISERLGRLSHLDLSNIKVAAQAPPAKTADRQPAEAPVPAEEHSLVALPISLAGVVGVQKRIQDTLGVLLPLSTLVSRAADLANDQLPRASNANLSADELFNSILGLRQVSKVSRGSYFPDIAGVLPSSLPTSAPAAAKKPDIMDVLTGRKRAPTAMPKSIPAGISTGANVFSLVVPPAEEKRARVFLERLKVVLEREPSRLVVL